MHWNDMPRSSSVCTTGCKIHILPFHGSTAMVDLASIIRFIDHTRKPPNRQDSSGQVIGPSQRPLLDNKQHSQETGMHAPGVIRTRNPSKRATGVGVKLTQKSQLSSPYLSPPNFIPETAQFPLRAGRNKIGTVGEKDSSCPPPPPPKKKKKNNFFSSILLY